MTRTRSCMAICAVALALPLAALLARATSVFADEPADEEFAKQPTWAAPSASAVRADVFKWLDERKTGEAVRKEVEALWPSDSGASAQPVAGDLLDSVVKSIALADAQSGDLVSLCAKPKAVGPLPSFPWLSDEKTPAFERNNLRLWYGRWLSQEHLYDYSLEQLSGLEPTEVVDPAALLFYQAAANHWLLHKEPGLKAIARLLERKKELPRRYAQLADLMQTDLAAVKEDSLDHIDRRMRDVDGRLDHAQAGKKVRGVEDGIIASLDKLIEEEEKRQQEAAAAAGSRMGPGGRRSSSPAPDSARLLGKGPGDVAKKPIGTHSNWGDLPAKERQEVLQAIGKEYPSHYRDVIEQYFKRLASEDEEAGR
jgi:hypothetical protein